MTDVKPNAETPVLDDVQAWRRMIAQTAALAVQDAAANMRNVNTINTAAVGAAQQMIVQGQSGDEAKQIMAIADTATTMARANFAAVAELADRLLIACAKP